ncbi:hypothetical protein PSHT_05534 [Puccinia striiformis]|uniref:Uncharacterized protein n=1 Tax=Puccinia striiformis TaxID=27350 RepID=A0A2S4WAD6_9BASI|nr:hypothetical protein PSHT_05534 [Puccinia striiformis]
MTSTNRHKRHKNLASTMSTDPSENNHPNKNEDKDEDNTKEDENENDRPQEDDEETGGRQQLTDKEELKRAQRTYENSVSACYKSYGTPEISEQKDKAGRRMIAYPCKMCGGKISRPTHDTSCGNLNKHVATCLRKQSETSTTQSWLSLGVTATGHINPKEVSC